MVAMMGNIEDHRWEKIDVIDRQIISKFKAIFYRKKYQRVQVGIYNIFLDLVMIMV